MFKPEALIYIQTWINFRFPFFTKQTRPSFQAFHGLKPLTIVHKATSPDPSWWTSSRTVRRSEMVGDDCPLSFSYTQIHVEYIRCCLGRDRFIFRSIYYTSRIWETAAKHVPTNFWCFVHLIKKTFGLCCLFSNQKSPSTVSYNFLCVFFSTPVLPNKKNHRQQNPTNPNDRIPHGQSTWLTNRPQEVDDSCRACLGVSENSGFSSKSSILIGCSLDVHGYSTINHPFWGTSILETPI